MRRDRPHMIGVEAMTSGGERVTLWFDGDSDPQERVTQLVWMLGYLAEKTTVIGGYASAQAALDAARQAYLEARK